MPTRNDAWILEKSLSALNLWADLIIVADQSSADETLEICNKFSKVKVIQNTETFHSTRVRQKLLDEARKTAGEKIIFNIDSDEFLTSEIFSETVWQNFFRHPPGTGFELQWLNLWQSPLYYRDDNSIWSNSWKSFVFIDSPDLNYVNRYGLNDHNPRVPSGPRQKIVRLEYPKVLHYQFVNLQRMLSKQRFYRVQDYLQKPGFFSAMRINRMYFASKAREQIKLSPVKPEWLEAYRQHNTDITDIVDLGPYWYDYEVLGWFREHKPGFFKWLDIWDINWEELRQKVLEAGKPATLPEAVIKDPRNFFLKMLHRNFGFFVRVLNLIAGWLKFKR